MRHGTWVTVGLALLLLAPLGPPVPAAAQIFRWVDEHGIVHYGQGIDSVPERHRGSAVLQGYRPAPPPQPRSEAVRPVSSGGPSTFSYTPGEPIVVIGRLNGSTSVRLLLDTGADRTLISPRALVAAGVSLTRGTVSGPLVGVTGTAEATAVVVQSLEIGEARVGPMLVIAFQMSEARHDGLLGRDFLDRFHVSIDGTRGLVTLAPR